VRAGVVAAVTGGLRREVSTVGGVPHPLRIHVQGLGIPIGGVVFRPPRGVEGAHEAFVLLSQRLRGGALPLLRAGREHLSSPLLLLLLLLRKGVVGHLRVPLDVLRCSVGYITLVLMLVLVLMHLVLEPVVAEIPGETVADGRGARDNRVSRRRAHRGIRSPAIGALLRDLRRHSLRDSLLDVGKAAAGVVPGWVMENNLLAAAASLLGGGTGAARLMNSFRRPLAPFGRIFPHGAGADADAVDDTGDDLICLALLAIALLALAVAPSRRVPIPGAAAGDRVPRASPFVPLLRGGAAAARVALEARGGVEGS